MRMKNQINILVVEDDPNLTEVLRMLFKSEGYQVTSASNGSEALELLRGKKEIPDLIVSDVMMPKMDGFQFCEALRKDDLFKQIPFIFLTALNQVDKKLKAYTLGADEYLVKPFSTEELTLKVKILLDRVAAYRKIAKKETSISGSLSVVSLIDLMQVLELSRKTGALEVDLEGRHYGAIFFKEGAIIDARAGELEREDALYSLLYLKQGFFSFNPNAPLPAERAIKKNNTSLMMEGLRIIDEMNQYAEFLPPAEEVFSINMENKEAAVQAAEEEPAILEILKNCKDPLSMAELLQRIRPSLGEMRSKALIGKMAAKNILQVRKLEKRTEEKPSVIEEARPEIRDQLLRIKQAFFKGKESGLLKILAFSADIGFVDRLAGHFNLDRRAGKEKTTAAATMMSFERVPLPEGVMLHIYRMPMEKRFSFMWETIFSDAHGYFILMEDKKSMEEAEFIYSFCQKKYPHIRGLMAMKDSVPVSENLPFPVESIRMLGKGEDFEGFMADLLQTILKKNG